MRGDESLMPFATFIFSTNVVVFFVFLSSLKGMLMHKTRRLHWTGNKGEQDRNKRLRKWVNVLVFIFGRYMNFMFDLEDASNDGAIDAAEFAIVCSSYGLDKAECEDAFRKMSQVSMFSIEKDVKFQFSCRLKRKTLIDNIFLVTGCWRSY